MPIRSLLLSIMVLCLCSCSPHKISQPEHPTFCINPVFGGIYNCSKKEAQKLSNLRQEITNAREFCKKRGLDFNGINSQGRASCCPVGTRQIGCVANLPCKCRRGKFS